MNISLTQGQVAIIDDVDSDLAELKWYAAYHPSYSGGGYVAQREAKIFGKRFTELMHRVILSRVLERELLADELVDHKDSNALNNRRDNLRLATFKQNTHNSRKMKNNTSGFIGVSWHKRDKVWCATICINNKNKSLGSYTDPVVAAKIYDAAAKELRGEFAVLNFPDRD